jgi:hypothetical protein
VLAGAAAGAALAGWGVGVRTGPAREPDRVAVRVEVFGKAAFEVVEAPGGGWSRWTEAARAAVGSAVGGLVGVLLAARAAARSLRYRLFMVLEALRGVALGAVAGLLVCGVGFAVLGAIICAMLEEPGWTLADALARGARLGGPFGILLGTLAGAVVGFLTALARATARYHDLHPYRP